MLTDEVRKFTDDDMSKCAAFLDMLNRNDMAAIQILEIASWFHESGNAVPESNECDNGKAVLLPAIELLALLDHDIAAARQLVIVTNSFRDLLGIKPSRDSTC